MLLWKRSRGSAESADRGSLRCSSAAWHCAGTPYFYLGRLFTVNVAIAADHTLIDSGPYRTIRHPSYTGALLVFPGLGISFGNWLSLIIVVVPTSLAFMQRIAIEEAALTRALGDSYPRYMARTKRLIPGVY